MKKLLSEMGKNLLSIRVGKAKFEKRQLNKHKLQEMSQFAFLPLVYE